jgi:tricorn protease
LASTDYGLQTGWLDMSSYDSSITRSLYCIVLDAKGKSPVTPKTDEATANKEATEDEKKSTKKATELSKENKTSIGENRIFDRAMVLKLAVRNYTALIKGSKNKVFISEITQNNPGFTIHKYDILKEKPTIFATEISSMTASNDRKSILLSKKGIWNIKNSTDEKSGKDTLKTMIKIEVDPKAEARRIFTEGWSYMRDFLYINTLHGAHWDVIYK